MSVTSSYVALGDSYAAGVGGGIRIGLCFRTTVGYPRAVAQTLGVKLSYRACLWATTSDVERYQLRALEAETAYVSLTVGGNDVGFVPVLISAAEPAWMTNFDAVLARTLRVMREELPGRLDRLYAGIRARAPRAQVVVTDYPRLFNGVDCNLVTFFSADEMSRLNAAADELAGTVRDASRGAGFELAGVRPRFCGHAVCDRSEWINGASLPLENSFHPNAAGHAAYGRAVLAALGVPASAQTEDGNTPLQVEHGREMPGVAPTFRLPDLLSARSLRGAAAHGIDPREVVRLGRIVQVRAAEVTAPGDADAIAQAWARLKTLDVEARTA